MPARKSKEKFNLVCVAHPDDETLFFGGLLQKKRSALSWKVICVTSDGNNQRLKDFESACRQLGVKDFHCWQFQDIFDQRLSLDQLIGKLKQLETPTEIFTHSPLGEYGHPHHQDVCMAVHAAFKNHKKLFSVAYNLASDLVINLDKKVFLKKAKILTETYKSETSRFLNILPITSSEGFTRLDYSEVQAMYNYFSGSDQNKEGPLEPALIKNLSKHRHLINYLPFLKNLKRPF
jgi:LmbE family N-acetylglucosaminyl deacetylase